MIIGITGGTGCGKSTLLKLLESKGCLCMDCDAIYHALLAQDKGLLDSIERRFPGTVENGQLNRKKLGSVVFSDSAALSDLNKITHSAVKEEVLRRLEEKPKLAAIDAIALHEGGLHSLCDTTVAILAPEEMRIARLMEREGISRQYAKSRIAAQHTDEWFRSHCDHVLENNDSLEAFQTKCLAFLASLGIM